MSRRRSVRKANPNYIWTVVESLNVSMTTSVEDEDIIVAGSDWAVATGRERGTLERLRGWIAHKVVPGGAAAHGSIFMAIVVMDQAVVVPPDLLLVDAYSENDILWTGGLSWSSSTATLGSTVVIAPVSIDVKSRRKLTDTQKVSLVQSPTITGTSPLSYCSVIRGLVRVP